MQNKFVVAISVTASVPSGSVVIEAVNEQQQQQRRTKSSSITVASKIAVKDISTASQVAAKLNSDLINRNLVLEGLPEGTLVSVATSSVTTADGVAQSTIIIAVLLGCLVLSLIVAAAIFLRRVESVEERVLRIAMNDLRVRLKITPSHAVLLSTESSITAYFKATLCPWSRSHKETTIIQKGYLEAATRLALMQVGTARLWTL